MEKKDPPKLVRFTAMAVYADGSSEMWDIKGPKRYDILENLDLINSNQEAVYRHPIISQAVYETTYRFAIVTDNQDPTVRSVYPAEEWCIDTNRSVADCKKDGRHELRRGD